jgi:molecular chaperone HtpG
LTNEYTITQLIKKYSDYIRHPIQTLTTTSIKDGVDDKGQDKYVDSQTLTTVNSQIPLWKQNKKKVTKQQYEDFYRDKFGDYSAPLKYIQTRIEGDVDFETLLYIPSSAPYNYYSKDYEKGLQLYASGVLITEKCTELLPDYFGFVRGVVDSNDLSLNISREVLQQDHQLRKIADNIQKKIRAELVKMLADDRQTYDKFFEVFGLTLKFGAYDGFGMHKDKLIDLLMFYSSTAKKLVTFKEYISRLKDDQKHIYYATGDSPAKLDRLPASEHVRDKGCEILYLTDTVDEFCIKIIDSYEGKKFMSVTSPELDLGQGNAAAQEEQHKDMLDAVLKELDGKVAAVKLSMRLKTHAVCLSAQGEISIEMEKVLTAMPDKPNVRANKVLEINPHHQAFSRLVSLYKSKSEDFVKAARVLHTTACIIEGLQVEDSVSFAQDLCALL